MSGWRESELGGITDNRPCGSLRNRNEWIVNRVAVLGFYKQSVSDWILLGDFGPRLLGRPPATVSLTIGGKWLEIDDGQEPKPQQLFADAIPFIPGVAIEKNRRGLRSDRPPAGYL
jgi:hypothetical protein